MNRASGREAIFTNDATCALFLDAVAEVPERFGARIHGYALMPNHFHLLVEVPRGNLSDVMKHVGSWFTQGYNRAHQHDGPVFRGRFRNALVLDDAYWMHLLAYLHLNPVKAHLAKRPSDCLWTSHNAYVDPRQRPDWLTCDELLGLFGSVAAFEAYVEAVHLKRLEPPEGFDPERFWRSPVTEKVPQPVDSPTRTAETAIADVAELTGVPANRVLELPRGRTPNRPAWLAIWWLLRSTGLSQREVGEIVGVSRPRVSQLLKKFHRLVREDAELRKWQETLEDRLVAGS
jgi:REP element-mobilizing transposase RayT